MDPLHQLLDGLRRVRSGRGLVVAMVVGCGQRVAPRADVAPVPSASHAVVVASCTDLAVVSATVDPGGDAEATPGARIVVRGRGLAAVTRLTVGGVATPFARVEATLVAEVPALLATGRQVVRAVAGACAGDATITVSRRLAVAHVGSGTLELLDARTLARRGSVATGLGSIAQARFTQDGRALVVRDGAGAVAFVVLADGRAQPVAARSDGPFVLAQSSLTPSIALLAVPGARTLFRLDAARGTVAPSPTTSRDPIGVTAPLDGFRALVLDRSGEVFAVDHPFAPAAAGGEQVVPARPDDAGRAAGAVRGAREITVAEGGVVAPGHGPIGAILDTHGAVPALVPMSALTGRIGARIAAPDAVGELQFISGDVLAMDARTSDLLVADVTTLDGTVARHPIAGEARAGVVRTTVARSTYVLGVLVLRAGDAGVPEAAALHVFDAHYEPPRERAPIALAGARGLVGLPGDGHPFVVWAARRVTRVAVDRPGETLAIDATRDQDDVALVVAQP